MGNITRLLKIGFGSFIDKNTYPFVDKYIKGFLILNYVLFFFKFIPNVATFYWCTALVPKSGENIKQWGIPIRLLITCL